MAKGEKEKEGNEGLLERFVPVLLLVSVVLAFVVGILWQKVSDLEGGRTTVADNQQIGENQPAGNAITQGKLSSEQAEKIPEVTDQDFIRGSSDAQVYLIEYSDFECPFCARFHETALQVTEEYDNVAWVYRHFPLDQLHPQARPAAIASECVADLGGDEAFWAFADEIFANQETALNDLESAAGTAGVNVADFSACVESDRFADNVEDDYQDGLTAGVTGTPGNFIVNEAGDAWFIPGALPYDSVKQMIEEALGN